MRPLTLLALGASLAAPSLAQPPPNAHVAEANFTQLIDHRDPSKGTFPQRYWYSSEHWAGPGAPVVITTPGEQSAETFWTFATNKSLTGVMAQNVRGATVVLEHRYWGESLPFDQLTEESFKYLTIENAIQDFVHFAKTVQLPFDKNHSSNAQHAPWVLSGGSYSGSLAAYTARKEPGTFWAYHATSAPVQAIYNFWQFLEPIMEGMPQNCSSDLNAMWNYVDGLYFSGKHDEVKKVQAKFGLEDLQYDDFGNALKAGPYSWLFIDFSAPSPFYTFCDYVENAERNGSAVPGKDGVGYEKALEGYARWAKELALNGACAAYGYAEWSNSNTTACLNMHNASLPYYHDLSAGNIINRQWQWILCNELTFWHSGDTPPDHKTIVSRALTADYFSNQCALFFPNRTYGAANNATATATNRKYGGWDIVDTPRLVWTNGQYDPWRDAGVSSKSRPAGPLNSTSQHPVNVIPKGVHALDYLMVDAEANQGVMDVVQREVKQIKEWVEEYYQPEHNKHSPPKPGWAWW